MRAELQPIWDQYAKSADPHWPLGAVYLRESKREQADGFSPSAQLKGTLDEALHQSLWVPADHVFLDLMSGRREDRVAFQDMLALARSGTVAAVIVLHTSRFSRNALVSRKYKDELRRRGVKVIATNSPFDVARPEGKLGERILEAFDEFTSDTIGWWVSVGLREKHERGEPLGRLPETFMRDSTSGGTVPHPELSRIVLEGARRYVTGRFGFGDLALWSEREGYRTPSGRPLSDEWWRNTLANPLNAGYVAYRRKRGGKELRSAAFAGFMPLELYEQVKAVRQARTRASRQGAHYRVYPLTGVAVCASCGSQVTASSKARMRCRRAAEHSGCSEPSVAASSIEDYLGRWLVEAVSLRQQDQAMLVMLIRRKASQGIDQSGAVATRQALKRLTDAFTWGYLPEPEYQERAAELRTRLDRATRVPDERRMLAATRLAQDIAAMWSASPKDRRKELLRQLFAHVRVHAGKVTSVLPNPELLPLFAVAVQTSGPDRIRTGDLVLDRDVC